jgi:hypothetical protein
MFESRLVVYESVEIRTPNSRDLLTGDRGRE